MYYVYVCMYAGAPTTCRRARRPRLRTRRQSARRSCCGRASRGARPGSLVPTRASRMMYAFRVVFALVVCWRRREVLAVGGQCVSLYCQSGCAGSGVVWVAVISSLTFLPNGGCGAACTDVRLPHVWGSNAGSGHAAVVPGLHRAELRMVVLSEVASEELKRQVWQ